MSEDGRHPIVRFPTPVHGAAAMIHNLYNAKANKKTYYYRNQTLQVAISNWCGKIRAQSYLSLIRQLTGLVPGFVLSEAFLRDPDQLIPLLKAMLQYWEAQDDPRVLPAITRYLHRLRPLLDDHPQNTGRWEDLCWSIERLYDLTDDRELLDIAAQVFRIAFDWGEYVSNLMIRERMLIRGWPHFGAIMDISQGSHVVHNAMAVKDPAVRYRLSGDPA